MLWGNDLYSWTLAETSVRKENLGHKTKLVSIIGFGSLFNEIMSHRGQKYHLHQLGPSQLRQQATHRNRRLHSSSQRCRPHLRIF